MKISHSLPFILLACVACNTPGPTVPQATLAADSLLLEVSSSEQQRIAKAREARAHAIDSYAAAKAQAEQARNMQISADMELEVAAAKVARADAEVTRVRATGTTDDVEAAKRNWQEAKDEHAKLAAEAKLADRYTTHARALAEVAREHVSVAEARVELAKAKAVNTLDRPAEQKPSITRFEESVRRAEADENLARTRSEATLRELELLEKTRGSEVDPRR